MQDPDYLGMCDRLSVLSGERWLGFRFADGVGVGIETVFVWVLMHISFLFASCRRVGLEERRMRYLRATFECDGRREC